jgi:hypothetical protein
VTKPIVSEKPGSVQALAQAAVDLYFAKKVSRIVMRALGDIAVLLATRKHKTHRATIEHATILSGDEQGFDAQSLSDALVVMRMRDPLRHQEAAYYAANAATPGGIGSLTLLDRQTAIELFEVSQRAYRDALTNNAPPDVMARLGRLLEADTAAGTDARVVGVVSNQPEGVM